MLKKFANIFKLIIKLIGLKCRYKDCLIFIAVSGIGDLCYALSFIEDIKTKTNKKVVVFTREYTREVVEAFPAINKAVILKSSDVAFFSKCELPRGIRPVFNKYSLKSGVFICTPLTEETYDCLKNNQTNYIDIIKEALADVQATNITYPSVPCLDIGKFGFYDIKKTVIINPYSNTLISDQMDLFEKIVELLKNKGYSVYTNTMCGQNPVDGTHRLECSLSELHNISRQCAAFISIRSGILDFMIGNGGNYLVLYDSTWDNKFLKAYSLTGWNTNSRVHEFLFSQEEKIFDYIDAWAV